MRRTNIVDSKYQCIYNPSNIFVIFENLFWLWFGNPWKTTKYQQLWLLNKKGFLFFCIDVIPKTKVCENKPLLVIEINCLFVLRHKTNITFFCVFATSLFCSQLGQRSSSFSNIANNEGLKNSFIENFFIIQIENPYQWYFS